MIWISHLQPCIWTIFLVLINSYFSLFSNLKFIQKLLYQKQKGFLLYISMAGAITASSPIYHHKLFNFSFTHSSLPHTLNFPHKTTTISSKLLFLNPQLFNPSSSLKLHPLHPPSFSFHQFQLTQEENNPETEPKTLQNPDPNFSQSKRLFVGNLPFSLSSSKLAQLFGEAGNVVSVEVWNFPNPFSVFITVLLFDS